MHEFSQIVIRRRLRRRFPAGLFAGLLAGSMATLIGVASGIDPFAICLRAISSGAMVGVATSLGVAVFRIANIEPEPQAGALVTGGGPTRGRRRTIGRGS